MSHLGLITARSLPLALSVVAISCQDQRGPTQPQPGSPAAPQARVTAVASNTWATKAPLPAPRSYHAMATLNGLLYVIGGSDDSSAATRTVYSYNPATNIWTTRAPLPAARSGGNGAKSIGGLIYLPGGSGPTGTSTKTLLVYNPSTNRWSRRADMPVAGSGGASAVIKGQLYVFTNRNALFRYNPATNAWTTLAPAPNPHRCPPIAAGAIASKVYVIGDCVSRFDQPLDIYDAATNTWTSRVPADLFRCCAAGAVLNRKFYVSGGSVDGFTGLPALLAYDPATNRVTFKANMPTERFLHAMDVLNGRLYVVGGTSNIEISAASDVVEVYTP